MSKNDQVEKVCDFGDFIIYKTTCDCMDESHQISILLQYNKEQFEANLYFKTIITDFISLNGKDSWFIYIIKKLFWRFKYAIKILWSGEITLDEAFIFRGKEHLQEFSQALINASDKVEIEYTEKIMLIEKLKFATEQLNDVSLKLQNFKTELDNLTGKKETLN